MLEPWQKCYAGVLYFEGRNETQMGGTISYFMPGDAAEIIRPNRSVPPPPQSCPTYRPEALAHALRCRLIHVA